MPQILEILPKSRAKNVPSPSFEPARLDPELELLARWMDSVFEIPGVGIRFGFDAILGLVPGLGDTLTSLVSLYILGAARRYGVSRVTMLRMALNIGIDYVVGAIPLVGDAFDVYWKANIKNVELVRQHLSTTRADERRARRGDWLFVVCLSAVLLLVLVGAVAVAWWLIGWLVHLVAHTAM